MDAPTIGLLRRLDAVASALDNALLFAVTEYANGGGRAAPGVDAHFTAGNQAREGWPPLSRAYFLAKQRGIVRQGGGHLSKPHGMSLEAFKASARGRKGSKLDPKAEFQSSTGELTGIGSASNLPMLVRTGATRAAVTSRRHEVRLVGPGMVQAIFRGLPGWAIYLHTGTPRMPKRSPVEPGPEDVAGIVASMQRFVDAAAGTAGAVPVGGNTMPNRARGQS